MNKKIGLFPGKFLPLHSGHIQSIIEASTKVDKLYVIGSYRDAPYTTINGKRITKEVLHYWLLEQFKGLNHIKVIVVDESNIPVYPTGWLEWSQLIKDTLHHDIQQYSPRLCDILKPAWVNTTIGEEIDLIIFGGEVEYRTYYHEHFLPCQYILIDPKRERNNIRATDIRNDMYSNWSFLPSVVRQTFVKRVLITGVESTGKSVLTRYLAKIFNTSWSEEVGRDYAKTVYNGNEKLLNIDDFARIAYLQLEQNIQAYRTANKITIIDTDAIVTQYYCELYTGTHNDIVQAIIDNTPPWDLILYMEPDVPWIDDGQRLNQDRDELNKRLKSMYTNVPNIHYINGSYEERLNKCYNLVKELL